MDSTARTGDRRTAVKARSRQAILDAAAELMDQRRSAEFSVDELAAAADVSRRTVFNHFNSLEEVVTDVAAQMFGEVIDRMEARAASEPRDAGTVLEDLAATASSVHLVPTVAFLVEVFGAEDRRTSTRSAVLMQTAIRQFTQRISVAMANRHPGVDPLKVELLVAAFSGGVQEMVDRWIAETAAADTAESRETWDRLISSLVTVLRDPAA